MHVSFFETNRKHEGWWLSKKKKKNLELATILSDVVFLGAGAKNLATP
jgi:hypothetical protein